MYLIFYFLLLYKKGS